MGGKSKQKQTTNSTTTGWKPVMDQFQNNVLPSVNQWGNDYREGQGLWTGSALGAEDPNVQLGQNQMLRAADQYGRDYQNVNKTLQGFLDYDPNSFQNQASRAALGANARAQFGEVIQPGIEDIGTMSGQFGGNQQNLALGAATAPLSRAIADNEVSLMNADRDRAFNAMLNAQGVMSGSFVPGQVYEGVGNARTQRGQMEQMDTIAQFEAQRNNRLRSLAEESGLLYPLAQLQQTSNSTTESQSKANPWQTAMGIGTLAASMYSGGGLGSLAGMFSKAPEAAKVTSGGFDTFGAGAMGGW
jgi:hypothetical protein